MKTIFIDKETPSLSNSVATIGFFDGVHRGHEHIIKQVIAYAREKTMKSMVITFDRHPQQTLRKDDFPKLLTTKKEKLYLLEKIGVDICTVLPFDSNLAKLSASEFMKGILLDKLNVKALVIGYDNRFGHNRIEGFEDYLIYGRALKIDVIQASKFTLEESKVSSSKVRRLLLDGDIEKAELLLGHPYFLKGSIIQGTHEGRRLGYPTANILIDDGLKLIPSRGVYAVKVKIEDSLKELAAMMNIGTRPTFGGHEISLEVHIFDFQGDIYGKSIKVSFCKRLRGEKKFTSTEELSHQLSKDMEIAKKILS